MLKMMLLHPNNIFIVNYDNKLSCIKNVIPITIYFTICLTQTYKTATCLDEK